MYHFIINPNAGSGRGWKVWRAIAAYMDRHNIEYEAVLTSGIGEARDAARELTGEAGKPCFLIVVGGDGTMNEVLDGVSFHGPLNLGYIPAGTGNDLWRSLHMPASPVKCLKKQLYPRRFSMIDYGVLSYGKGKPFHRRFLVSAGIGFDAAVCQAALNSRLRSRLGHMGFRRLSYLLLGIGQFFKCRSSRGYIVLDGVKRVEFNNILFISCHIQPSEGGGFAFAPKTGGKDGLMNICVVSHPNRMKLLSLLLGAMTGRRKRYKGTRTYECREAQIHIDIPLPVHVDGEVCGNVNDIQAECIPRKVRMVF